MPPLPAAFFMANAKRDNNRIPTLIAASRTDGTTPINIYVNPTTHQLMVETNAVAITQRSVAPRDANRIPVLLGVSSSNGTTPVTICCNPTTHGLFVEPT